MTIFGQPGADQAYGVINGESWSAKDFLSPLHNSTFSVLEDTWWAVVTLIYDILYVNVRSRAVTRRELASISCTSSAMHTSSLGVTVELFEEPPKDLIVTDIRT